MSHSYTAQYPADSSVPLQIQKFFENFYRRSDIPGKHEQYVSQFTPEATFILASRKTCGSQEIMSTRIGMWSAVSARRHNVYQVFPSSTHSNEFMLHGVVALKLRSGASVNADWAVRAQVIGYEDGNYRMKYYQVYMDTGVISAAMQVQA